MHQIIKKNYFKNGKVYIWKETFAIIKSKKSYPNAFANIIDKNETTVIIEQSKYSGEDVIEIEKDYEKTRVLSLGLVSCVSSVRAIDDLWRGAGCNTFLFT